MTGVLQDFRYSVRCLRKTPGFACTVILILSIAIGGTTAIFSAVYPILYKPLPYPNANRVLMIWYAEEQGARISQTFNTYREVVERNRSFDAIAVVKPWQPTLTGEEHPERFDGEQVSSSYFRTLSVAPAMGRDFVAANDVPNSPKVAILSDGLWHRRFGGDATIIGRQVTLDGDSYTVIGVMPRAFSDVLAPTADLWSPLQYDAGNIANAETREWGHHLRMLARLRSGVSIDQARSDLAWIARTPVSEFPRPRWASLDHGFIASSLQDDAVSGVKPALLAVFAAVILLLLIACVNVTNLLLARSAQRRSEFSMRVTLGAGRSRLIRQLLTESLLLAILGGAVGMLVAQTGVRTLLAIIPPGLPRVDAIRLDGTVFVFALGVTALIGMLVGLVPARFASRAHLHMGVQEGSWRTTGNHQWTRRMFAVTEVALALVLLVSGGLLLRSLQRLFAVPTGFDGSGLLTLQLQTPERRYDDDHLRHQFFEQALLAVRQVPGVAAAAFTSQLPLSGDSDVYGARFENDAPDARVPVFRYAVTPGYFETIGIPLLRGRLLTARDVAGAPPSILISQSLAKRRFPGQDPAGKRVQVGGAIGAPMYTVVGVVGDVKQMSLALSESDAVYMTTTQWPSADRALSLVVRGYGDVTALTPAIKNAIWSVDKDQPIIRVASMNSLLAASAAERHFVLILFEAFGLVALILAATGIYGVLSGSVTERTREIGVRAAFGATREDILSLVIRQGMTLTLIGLALGLFGAMVASQGLAAMLFGVSSLDPLTYTGVVVMLGVVSAVACAVPAWRAARIDPMVALRYE
jgi:putative ABC transport system permease protein